VLETKTYKQREEKTEREISNRNNYFELIYFLSSHTIPIQFSLGLRMELHSGNVYSFPVSLTSTTNQQLKAQKALRRARILNEIPENSHFICFKKLLCPTFG
jgi:hypothetical protein